MPEEACAFVCGLLSTICAVLSWYTMMEGDWQCMIVTVCFAAIVVLLAGYALVHRYCM